MANNKNPYPLTVEEAVDRLHVNISLNDEIRLAAVTEDDLSNFHFSLGHHIRNEFGLWSGNDALLESCRIIAGKQDLHVERCILGYHKGALGKAEERRPIKHNRI